MIQKTIKIKGEKNNVKINSCDKTGFTLILIISAAGTFLTPILIAKGKTTRSLKKFDIDDKPIIGTYSNNGWTNRGIMKIALREIHKKTNGQKSILLLDQFPAHKDELIVNEAKKYNIRLIFIPKGKTSIFQPLDVSINGILKEKAKKLWRQERINNPDKKITVDKCIKHFLSAKSEISKGMIIKSFNISCLNKKHIIQLK